MFRRRMCHCNSVSLDAVKPSMFHVATFNSRWQQVSLPPLNSDGERDPPPPISAPSEAARAAAGETEFMPMCHVITLAGTLAFGDALQPLRRLRDELARLPQQVLQFLAVVQLVPGGPLTMPLVNHLTC